MEHFTQHFFLEHLKGNSQMGVQTANPLKTVKSVPCSHPVGPRSNVQVLHTCEIASLVQFTASNQRRTNRAHDGKEVPVELRRQLPIFDRPVCAPQCNWLVHP